MSSGMWQLAIFLPFGSGVILGMIGMMRVLQRAGIEENGLASKILMTKEQHQAQQDKVFLTLFDPTHPLDRWLIFGGFAICGFTAICLITAVSMLQ